jgi:hypothetical protein
MHQFAHMSLVLFAAMTSGIVVLTDADAAVSCEHSVDAPVPTLFCRSSSSPSEGSEAWISLRKMPAWGTNAGLTIVDLCLDSDSRKDGKFDPTLIVSQDFAHDGANERNCLRRYCTDQKRAFSFTLNSIPFPIGWTMVRFRFGGETQSFSISCDEFSHRE